MFSLTRGNRASKLLPMRYLTNICGIVVFLLLFISLTWSSLRQILYDHGVLHTEGITYDRTSQPGGIGAVPKPDVSVDDANSNIGQIQNATLGFQKIFVLSMPQRRDKRDAVALSAYMSGLQIEFVDGVNGSAISPKERPDNWEHSFNTDGGQNLLSSLGCWRGHMDIYQKMVREHIQSALILEDDVDWDVMIKAQMTEIARGSKYLQNSTGSDSPYGDNWWMITTGHCGSYIDTKRDQELWVIDGDPTVVPWTRRDLLNGPNAGPKPLAGKNTRLVFTPKGLVCTTSYAITLDGVSRMLYDQDIRGNAQPIDLALGHWCERDGQTEGRCLGVHPPITGVHIPAGDKNKGSDRQDFGTERVDFASSKNIVYSTRLNLEALVAGNTTVRSQYPGQSMFGDIDISELKLPHGKPVVITKEQYAIAIEVDEKVAAAKAKEDAKKEKEDATKKGDAKKKEDTKKQSAFNKDDAKNSTTDIAALRSRPIGVLPSP